MLFTIVVRLETIVRACYDIVLRGAFSQDDAFQIIMTHSQPNVPSWHNGQKWSMTMNSRGTMTALGS